MLTKEQILETLQKSKPRLSELGVQRIGLFGSYAKGTYTEDSDADLFAELENNDYRILVKVLLSLEAILQTKVDLIYNGPHIRPSFLRTVQQEIIYV